MVAILDANTVIQYVEQDHALGAATTGLLASIDDEFVVNCVNLAEVLVGAVRTDTVEPVVASITGNLGADIFDGSGLAWATRIATLRATAVPKIALADAIALATAIDLGGSLVTYDHALRAAAKKAAVPVFPENLDDDHASAPTAS